MNETRILQGLGKSRDLVIKKTDKGSCIVVQDHFTYTSEASSHLTDTSKYKLLYSIAKNIGELVTVCKNQATLTNTHIPTSTIALPQTYLNLLLPTNLTIATHPCHA